MRKWEIKQRVQKAKKRMLRRELKRRRKQAQANRRKK